eukprot:TRINITY_DN53833_c0_g1_i1.p1 TRINITY_DN53833_c0_g1~~TRINITY_DN53833_c0_g1_i1.p1  ORF type:complete len:438 (-),score=58.72 TRINITY_DN53833_c0_g1_i1:111-1424(-)
MSFHCAAFAFVSFAVRAFAGCTDGGNGGCGPPVGDKWDRWDMAGSTYAYCWYGCVLDWLFNNTKPLGLPEYGGVVAVDHYWTHQGMPCVDGKPQEFVKQDALTLKWKAQFPTMRMLQYRILSAVNYDMVIQDKINTDPWSVIRWRHKAGKADEPGDNSICWNGKSPCFNSPRRINHPANKCSFHISAAAYNWTHPNLASWFVEKVVAPSLVHADGIWLDGIGPDNGAWMCSGVCCGYDKDNSPLVQSEIDAHCQAQAAATTQAQQYLIQNGGWEAMRCFDYKSGAELPNAKDSPAACAQKLEKWAAFGANHSNYNFIVAYGDRTAGRDGYDDSTVGSTVAAFMLIRGQHWLFSIGPNGGSLGKSYPPYDQDPGSLKAATAKILLSDYGRPQGGMTAVSGKQGVYQRVYEKATVTLDCATFQGTFVEHEDAHSAAYII